MELRIPIADIGLAPGGQLGIQVVLTRFLSNSNTVVFSSQNLPTLPDNTPNDSPSTPMDFNDITGLQYAVVSTVPEPASLVLLGLSGLAMLRRSDSCVS